MNPISTDKLQSVFRAVFELSDETDPTGVRQDEEPKWDSLRHVALMAAVESEFGVRLDASDALRMTSYRETELMLAEKGA